MKKKKTPPKRPIKGMPGKGTVWFTVLMYANDAAVEKAVREELAFHGITTPEQMRVVAMAEKVWMDLFMDKYPRMQRHIFQCRNSATLTNPTAFGIVACQALAEIERQIGALDNTLRYSTVVGYALVYEAAFDIDKAADTEKKRSVRRKGTDSMKAKADERRALVQRLLEAAAKAGDLDVADIARQAGCSTDTVYRYVRDASRKRGR